MGVLIIVSVDEVHDKVWIHFEPRDIICWKRAPWCIRFISENPLSARFGLIELHHRLSLEEITLKVQYIGKVINYSLILSNSKIMTHSCLVRFYWEMFNHWTAFIDSSLLSIWFCHVLSKSKQIVTNYFRVSSEWKFPIIWKVFLS